jgi:TolB-like protein/Tfp pilus assembly protein PilF
MTDSSAPGPNSVNFDSERAKLVRSHLQEVLSSAAFANSKRAREFLLLVVEHALATPDEALKERMIGAEMFGRPADYDAANDAVVRVQATDVRRRLAQFYAEAPDPVLRVELPVGSYMPKFIWREEKPPNLAAPAEGGHPRHAISKRNIAISVAALALMAVVSYFVTQKLEALKTSARIRSVAVLPLANSSGDPRQDYFADGMTDELITELGQVPSLRVISKTSSMTYKGTKKTLPEIARELRVDGIVEGAVVREGERVRITAELVSSRTDQHVWAHSYERDVTTTLDLQRDVALAIADEIRVELTPKQQAALSQSRPIKPEALELYLQGMQRLNSGNPLEALSFLQKSIAVDSGYAPVHTALANAYGWAGEAGWLPYGEAFPKQKEEALTAIRLDETRPEPHLELGRAALNLNWDWNTQGEELRKALALSPESGTVHAAYAAYLSRVGRADEAIEESNRALQLDPVSSRSYMGASFVAYYARRYDEALELIQRAVALHPDPLETLFPLSSIYAAKGQYEEAIQGFEKLGDLPHALGHKGNAYAMEGKTAEARAILPKLRTHIEKSGIGRYEIALVYVGLHDNDHAFEFLDRAFDARDKGLTYLLVDPCLDPLRSDARFRPLLQRVGFPN